VGIAFDLVIVRTLVTPILLGGQGRRCEPRRDRGSLRAHRVLFPATGVLCGSAADRSNDGHYPEDHGRSTRYSRHRDKRD